MTAPNDKIIEHNHLFAAVAELMGLIQSYQASINNTQAKMEAGTVPNLPAIKNFISGIYYRSQEDCIRALDMLSRSYNYYNLTDGDALAETLKQGNPTQVDAMTLGAARVSLESYLFKNPIHGQKPFPDPTAGSARPITPAHERSTQP